MNYQELLLELNKYAHLYTTTPYEKSGYILTELEILLKKYLDEHPSDIEAWLKLIRVEFLPTFLGPDIFEEYFQKTLAIEKRPLIYVLKAYAQYITQYIFPETYEQLCAVKAYTNDDKAIVAYMKALGVDQLVGAQPKEFELYMLQSIQYGPSFFWNHVDLGEYYVSCNQVHRGKALIAKGLQNVVHIYTDDGFYDPTDIYEFLNERIKGIHLTDSNYNRIAKKLAALEKIDTSNEYWDII